MSDLIDRKAAAIKTFNKIGKANGSSPPESDSNTFGLAYEMFIADALYDVAKARREAAREQARAAGLFEADYSVGTHVPYNANGLSVVAKRNQDSTTLDNTKLRNKLVIEMGQVKADTLLSECSKPRKGNLTISVGME